VSGEGRRCVKKGLLIWVGSWNKESKLVDRYKKFFWDSSPNVCQERRGKNVGYCATVFFMKSPK
jgi:hypothetical protein